MESTIFNPAQLHLLRMMSYVRTKDELDDLQEAVTSYFADRIDKEMDDLCTSGDITAETIESWGQEHMRTAYK